ncbi:UBX domain-containing protein 4 isoform X2 [Pocillopora verrucosa]|uniref:UBX domain-containing protein 4 isoform X2 n=1 Tax=Pocillopora verrucosa TaxID=203993 RepID=UPI00333F7556
MNFNSLFLLLSRAKQLIEQRRLEKEESENQETKKKEFDRRHQGQELGKAKRDREERQAQNIVNQIKEDRAKERAHREAVRQQIARDKAEREARRQNEVQERQRAQAASPSPSTTMTGGSEGLGKTECFVFQMAVCYSLSPDTPLETIQQYMITQLGPSTSSITMYTTYPRRELTEEDLVKTLAELGLAPSSTLIVAVRGSNSLAPCVTSSFPELLLWVLSPLLTLINFLKAFLFGCLDQSRGIQNPPSQRTNSSTQSQPSK